MPIFEINSKSMFPLYKEGDIVLSVKTTNFKTGDVIAFYHGNKILIKRVIAGANNWINIDENGRVYINGTIIDELFLVWN